MPRTWPDPGETSSERVERERAAERRRLEAIDRADLIAERDETRKLLESALADRAAAMDLLGRMEGALAALDKRLGRVEAAAREVLESDAQGTRDGAEMEALRLALGDGQ